MTRKRGADSLISPILSLSLRLTRKHFQGDCKYIIYKIDNRYLIHF